MSVTVSDLMVSKYRYILHAYEGGNAFTALASGVLRPWVSHSKCITSPVGMQKLYLLHIQLINIYTYIPCVRKCNPVQINLGEHY